MSLSGLADLPVAEARRVNDREAIVMFGEVQPVHRVEERTIDGPSQPIRVRIYHPSAKETRPTLVYFHGGGWVVGSLDSHDGVARHLCRFGRCTVVAVDYRLAPEERFPAAVEDAWAATEWAAGMARGRLFIGGDSAGGNLAAVVALDARRRGIELGFQMLVYPVLDCASTAESSDYTYWVDQYLGDRQQATRVDASPLRATDLSTLPPTLVLSCDNDPLRAQADELTRRLREIRVPIDHIVYSGLLHGAYRMPGVLPEARKMLDDSAAALLAA